MRGQTLMMMAPAIVHEDFQDCFEIALTGYITWR
jgi:hypothetical protein